MSVVVEGASRFKDFSSKRVTSRRIAIWVSLSLICFAAMVALLLLQGIDRQLRDVMQTQGVRTAARELTNTLNQAEASQRGYLLTEGRQFLQQFELAATGIDQRLQTLIDMSADDQEQSRRLKSVIGDIPGKSAEMSRTVELVRAERLDEAQSLMQTGMGARLMAEVSNTLEAFIAEEDERLAARNRAIDQSRLGLVSVLLAALFSAAILAYALLTKTQRQVNKLTQQQRGLVSQNEALELLVTERTAAIEVARAHAERERERVEALLQDTNHRIGNSLATVSSLLALQMLRTRSDAVHQALEAAQLRVHAIASAHRRLRLGADMDSASADEFLQAVIDDIAATQVDRRNVSIRGDIAAIEVAARDATTLGILVGELVTNALKHAFPGDQKGTILVRLFRDAGNVVILEVSDDGVGLLENELAGEGGLGSVIVRQLSGPFGGEPIYSAGPKGGLLVTVALPKLVQPLTARLEI